MLCDNQQCSYSHWILHANYDFKSTIHNGNKFSRNQDKRLYDKQKVVTSCPISKISINYAYPKQELLDKNFKNKMKKKKTSQECILIPKDPTSPYAFTENGFSFNKPKKNKFLVNQDQACCVCHLLPGYLHGQHADRHHLPLAMYACNDIWDDLRNDPPEENQKLLIEIIFI